MRELKIFTITIISIGEFIIEILSIAFRDLEFSAIRDFDRGNLKQ